MNGLLMTHRGAIKVPKASLYHMQTPARMESWVPVPHSRLIDTIQTVLKSKGLSVKREEYAVMRNDNILFGVMDLTWETSGRNAALGVRTSNNKSFAIQIAIGARVLVCDNLMLSGELIALKRKHTANLDLVQECSRGIDRYISGYETLNQGIRTLEPVMNFWNISEFPIVFYVTAKFFARSRSLQVGNFSSENVRQCKSA